MVDSKRTILIADDSSLHRKMVNDFIHAVFPNRYITEIFSDGVELRNRLERSVKGVSAILTDNDMKEGPARAKGPQGIDLIEEYHGRKGFPPFVLITSDGGGISEEAKKYGACFLAKPYDLGQFEEVVGEALNGSE